MLENISNVVVFGMGALGSAVADRISRSNKGVHVFGAVRDLSAYWGSPIIIDGSPLGINYRSVGTLSSVPVDLIIICVKSFDFSSAVDAISPLIGRGTVILPLTTGPEHYYSLVRSFPDNVCVKAVSVGADIKRNGHFVSVASPGTVCLGPGDSCSVSDLMPLKSFFEASGMKCVLTPSIDSIIWKEFMFESCFGRTSVVFQSSCGDLLANSRAMEVYHEAMCETVAIAGACGVSLSDADVAMCEEYVKSLPADWQPPLLQDYWQNRHLESDSLSDCLCARADEHRIHAPANKWLSGQIHSMIKKRGDFPVNSGEIKSLNTRSGILAAPDKIASQLRFDIMRGKYSAGEMLAENELSSHFEASRSSVRSALQMLAGDGLLRTLPNGRREVLGFSKKQVSDLFEMRYVLENMALSLVLEREDSVFPDLTEVLDKMYRKYKSQSINEDPAELDVMFHRKLVGYAGNPFLLNCWESIARLWYSATFFASNIKKDSHYLMESYGTHKHIYELILAGDRAVFPELKRHIDEECALISAVVGGLSNRYG